MRTMMKIWCLKIRVSSRTRDLTVISGVSDSLNACIIDMFDRLGLYRAFQYFDSDFMKYITTNLNVNSNSSRVEFRLHIF